MKRIIPLLAAALCASAAFGAEVPTELYRSVMPDGSIRYGESPEPGAKQVRKLQTVPASTGVTVATPTEMRDRPSAPGGGVTVLPAPQSPPHEPAEAGRTQRDRQYLPKRQ